jgi:hypothetical protein
MAEDRSETSRTAEQTEERTVSSDRFDDVVESLDGLKQSVDELGGGSPILFDESPSPIERPAGRKDDLIGGTRGGGLGVNFPGTSTDPLGIDPSPSNRELKERLDDVVEALNGLVDVLVTDEQRPSTLTARGTCSRPRPSRRP